MEPNPHDFSKTTAHPPVIVNRERLKEAFNGSPDDFLYHVLEIDGVIFYGYPNGGDGSGYPERLSGDWVLEAVFAENGQAPQSTLMAMALCDIDLDDVMDKPNPGPSLSSLNGPADPLSFTEGTEMNKSERERGSPRAGGTVPLDYQKVIEHLAHRGDGLNTLYTAMASRYGAKLQNFHLVEFNAHARGALTLDVIANVVGDVEAAPSPHVCTIPIDEIDDFLPDFGRGATAVRFPMNWLNFVGITKSDYGLARRGGRLKLDLVKVTEYESEASKITSDHISGDWHPEVQAIPSHTDDGCRWKIAQVAVRGGTDTTLRMLSPDIGALNIEVFMPERNEAGMDKRMLEFHNAVRAKPVTYTAEPEKGVKNPADLHPSMPKWDSIEEKREPYIDSSHFSETQSETTNATSGSTVHRNEHTTGLYQVKLDNYKVTRRISHELRDHLLSVRQGQAPCNIIARPVDETTWRVLFMDTNTPFSTVLHQMHVSNEFVKDTMVDETQVEEPVKRVAQPKTRFLVLRTSALMETVTHNAHGHESMDERVMEDSLFYVVGSDLPGALCIAEGLECGSLPLGQIAWSPVHDLNRILPGKTAGFGWSPDKFGPQVADIENTWVIVDTES